MRTSLLRDILDLFFPRTCAICGNVLAGGEEMICIKCLFRMPGTDTWKHQYWTPSIGVFLCDTVISTKRSVLNCTDILQKIHAGRVAAAYRMCYDEVQNFKRSDEF